jgi:hypothetical protein
MSEQPITPLTVFGTGHGDQPSFEEIQAALSENSVPMPTPGEAEEAAEMLFQVVSGIDPDEKVSPEVLQLAVDTANSIISAIDSMSCDIGDDFGPCDDKHCPVCGGHYRMMAFSYPKPCSEGCNKKDKGDDEAYRMTAL